MSKEFKLRVLLHTISLTVQRHPVQHARRIGGAHRRPESSHLSRCCVCNLRRDWQHNPEFLLVLFNMHVNMHVNMRPRTYATCPCSFGCNRLHLNRCTTGDRLHLNRETRCTTFVLFFLKKGTEKSSAMPTTRPTFEEVRTVSAILEESGGQVLFCILRIASHCVFCKFSERLEGGAQVEKVVSECHEEQVRKR